MGTKNTSTDKLEIDDDWKTSDLYPLAEKALSFWEGDEDDNIFDESISL